MQAAKSSQQTSTSVEICTSQPTPSERIEPTASETSIIPTRIDPHLIETLIGDSPPLIIHKLLEGEGYIWLAQSLIELKMPSKRLITTCLYPRRVNTILVIPVNTSDVTELPQFSAYMIEGEITTIEKMAELLKIDVELLKKV